MTKKVNHAWNTEGWPLKNMWAWSLLQTMDKTCLYIYNLVLMIFYGFLHISVAPTRWKLGKHEHAQFWPQNLVVDGPGVCTQKNKKMGIQLQIHPQILRFGNET